MKQVAQFFTKTKIYPVASAVMLLLWLLFFVLAWPLCIFPAVAMLLPVYVCFCAARAGRLPALLCLLLAMGLGWFFGGGWLLLFVVILIVPTTLISLISLDQRRPFWPSVGVGTGGIFASIMAVVGIAWLLVGGDLITALRDGVESFLAAYPQTDQLLYMMHAYGLLQLPEGMEATRGFGEFIWLNPEAREQLMKGLLYQFETGMRIQMPTQIVSGTIFSGVFAIALPRYVQRGRMGETEEAPMPSFSTWALPAQVGKMLAVTLLGIGAVMMFSQGTAVYGTFITLWAGVEMVMQLQGAATLAFWMKKGGVRRGGRVAAIVLAALFFGSILWIIGCLDQFMDLRRLRLPTDNQEGEDDR